LEIGGVFYGRDVGVWLGDWKGEAIMNRVKRMIASLLNFVVLSVLFIGSCVGPGVMYYVSPWWFLKKVDHADPGLFFVAFRSTGDDGLKEVNVMRYRFDSEKEKRTDVQFHLPNGHHNYSSGPDKENASIDVKADDKGSQIVQVFVSGDTPWTSLSEYRVTDNKIYPLRHAHSVAWLLLGIIACPFLLFALKKPVRRGINRCMRIDP
jgi:hypothetical protein